jgi:cation transporter-like permease
MLPEIGVLVPALSRLGGRAGAAAGSRRGGGSASTASPEAKKVIFSLQ